MRALREPFVGPVCWSSTRLHLGRRNRAEDVLSGPVFGAELTLAVHKIRASRVAADALLLLRFCAAQLCVTNLKHRQGAVSTSRLPSVAGLFHPFFIPLLLPNRQPVDFDDPFCQGPLASDIGDLFNLEHVAPSFFVGVGVSWPGSDRAMRVLAITEKYASSHTLHILVEIRETSISLKIRNPAHLATQTACINKKYERYSPSPAMHIILVARKQNPPSTVLIPRPPYSAYLFHEQDIYFPTRQNARFAREREMRSFTHAKDCAWDSAGKHFLDNAQPHPPRNLNRFHKQEIQEILSLSPALHIIPVVRERNTLSAVRIPQHPIMHTSSMNKIYIPPTR